MHGGDEGFLFQGGAHHNITPSVGSFRTPYICPLLKQFNDWSCHGSCQNPTQLRKCVGVRHSSHVYPTTPPHAQTIQPLLDQLESCNLAQTLIALGFDN